jgi:hypothetical protein
VLLRLLGKRYAEQSAAALRGEEAVTLGTRTAAITDRGLWVSVGESGRSQTDACQGRALAGGEHAGQHIGGLGQKGDVRRVLRGRSDRAPTQGRSSILVELDVSEMSVNTRVVRKDGLNKKGEAETVWR